MSLWLVTETEPKQGHMFVLVSRTKFNGKGYVISAETKVGHETVGLAMSTFLPLL